MENAGVKLMRVISGKAKGRKLKQPKTDKVRPTQDKVKEALFDIIAQKVAGAKFLDLYAGVGAVGIEALSREAGDVVFIEQKPKYIYENLQITGLTGRVYATKVATALKVLNKHQEKFDIIFLDPPYFGEEAESTLNNISTFDILTPNGLVIVEYHKSKNLSVKIGELEEVKKRFYGQTGLSFYKKVHSKS
ncbi:MAG: 16S rRNA (guanine(966)-N(2))-methyltransferase RsmD [Candidatus Margulisbacteria bacterium]|nr:16S rRNA (guanine(966)-N(2))-methyltransferase RsmD [Candidatus Margulisiibacteriota bacterium]